MASRPDQSGTPTPPRPLLSIGYGGSRTSEEFVELLHRHEVRYLVDVRSKPFSKFRPEFSKDSVEAILRAAGLGYLFLGRQLGGLPDDPSCYRDGKVDYGVVQRQGWFIDGIDRLVGGWRAGHGIAIMCAEVEPERCHRSKLIGEALTARGIPICHIDVDGGVVSQAEVMDRLTGGQGELFERDLTSRKSYQQDDREHGEAVRQAVT